MWNEILRDAREIVIAFVINNMCNNNNIWFYARSHLVYIVCIVHVYNVVVVTIS